MLSIQHLERFLNMPNTSAKEKLNTNDTLLSVSEAAKLLRISPSSLRRFELENKISSTRKENGYRMFDRSEVLKLKGKLETQKYNEIRANLLTEQEIFQPDNLNLVSIYKPYLKQTKTLKEMEIFPPKKIERPFI